MEDWKQRARVLTRLAQLKTGAPAVVLTALHILVGSVAAQLPCPCEIDAPKPKVIDSACFFVKVTVVGEPIGGSCKSEDDVCSDVPRLPCEVSFNVQVVRIPSSSGSCACGSAQVWTESQSPGSKPVRGSIDVDPTGAGSREDTLELGCGESTKWRVLVGYKCEDPNNPGHSISTKKSAALTQVRCGECDK